MSNIPCIIDDQGIPYKNDKEKADLFGLRLENTFSDSNNSLFDNNFKVEVISKVKEHNLQFTNLPFSL